MSRPTVARRLTAVIALLAVLCLALPAAAAPGGHGPSPRTRAVHAPSLVDQLFAWIGSFWTGPSQGQAGRTEKAGSLISNPGSGNSASSSKEADKGSQVDPNG